MGISFKVSKTGTRFKPKPIHPQNEEENDVAFEANKERNFLSVNESNSTSAAGKLTGAVVLGSKDVTRVRGE